MQFKSIVLAMLASTISTLAMADLQSIDLSAPGDRLLTVDTQTHLVWLNLSQTRGLSLDQVSAAGWFDQGFGLATEAQVVDLMQSTSPARALAALGGQRFLRTSGDVTWLASGLVGAVASAPLASNGQILVRGFEDGPYLTAPTNAEPVPGDRGWWCSPELSEFACMPTQPADGGEQDQAVRREVFVSTLATWSSTRDNTPDAGVFLVKAASAVPEPTSWMLMGVGLAGLAVLRSRRRQLN